MLGRERHRGFALIAILCIALIVASMVGVAALAMQKRLGTSVSQDQQIQAQYAAQAGLAQALIELKDDEHWQEPSGLFAGQLAGTIFGYEVEVLNNRFGGGSVTAPDGAPLAPGYVWLRATGLVDGKPIRGSSGQAKIRTTKPLPSFDNAFESYFTCTFWGRTDSYNSAVDPSPTSFGAGGDLRWHNRGCLWGGTVNGDLVTDQTNETIPVLSNTDCTSENPFAIKPAASLNGTPRTNTAPVSTLVFTLPAALEGLSTSVTPPGPALAAGQWYDCASVDQSYIFGSGEYHMENLTLSEGQTMSRDPGAVGGPTTLYISGDFHCSGSINVNGKPEDFRIFALGSPAPGIFFDNTTPQKGHMVVAGFNLNYMSVSGGGPYELFGGVIGHDLFLFPSATIHYDESLRNRRLQPASTEWVLVNEAIQ